MFDSKVKVAGKLRNVAMNAWEKYENNNTGHDLWDLRPADHKAISDFYSSVEIQQSCWS